MAGVFNAELWVHNLATRNVEGTAGNIVSMLQAPSGWGAVADIGSRLLQPLIASQVAWNESLKTTCRMDPAFAFGTLLPYMMNAPDNPMPN
jgi:hypothetical protein